MVSQATDDESMAMWELGRLQACAVGATARWSSAVRRSGTGGQQPIRGLHSVRNGGPSNRIASVGRERTAADTLSLSEEVD